MKTGINLSQYFKNKMNYLNKISKKNKVSKNVFVRTTFLQNDRSIKLVEKQIFNIYRNIKKFYRTDINNINIELIYSRNELNNKLNRKTQNWLAGVSYKKIVYIFSPSAIEIHSTHKKNEFKKILTHEICHIFNKKINKNISTLVDEGIALFLSNQKKPKNFEKSDLQFFNKNSNNTINFNSFAKHNGYKISYWLIKKYTNKHRKSKLLDLIKNNKDLTVL